MPSLVITYLIGLINKKRKPAIDANKAKRAYALIETLPDIRQKLKKLDKEIEKLKTK